jgi:hypothetical protein
VGTYRTIRGIIRSELAGKVVVVLPDNGGVWMMAYDPELRLAVVRATRTAVPQRITIEGETIVGLADA